MKRKLFVLLALALCLFALASCGEAETPVAPETVSFTDSVGRVVEVPAEISRVSPSGALAQMYLVSIAPELLVTVASEYAEEDMKYIPSALGELPVVGQFYGSDDLNYESIAAIGPEIVIDVGEPKKTIVEDMDGITEKLAIPAVHVTATLAGAPEAFRTLGKLLNREEKGEALAAYCEKILARTDEIMERVGDDKVSVLYCLGDAGLNVLAASS
ncbi:MAG: ABC transporter substrate-binding protein, partial [Clostridiales Family XIII bacterium]|nr:ABC transporter substrate-binding protein [Clostridiales Family XIII bacterium]